MILFFAIFDGYKFVIGVTSMYEYIKPPLDILEIINNNVPFDYWGNYMDHIHFIKNMNKIDVFTPSDLENMNNVQLQCYNNSKYGLLQNINVMYTFFTYI